MTVRQSAQQSYNLELQEVTASVRKVLDGHSIYKRTSERTSASGTGITFYTNVRPGMPLVLGTDMYISLEPNGEKTLATVTVASQVWIYGDAFGMYEGYIRTFFARLNEEARQGANGPAAQITSGGPIYQRTNSLTSVLILGAILLLNLSTFVIFIGPAISSFPSMNSCYMLAFFSAISLLVLVGFIRALVNLRRPR